MVTRGRRRASGWARLWALVFVGGAACNALVGIDEPSVVEQEHCAASSDCSNQGYVCVLGLCAPSCSADGDCGPALRCLKSNDGSTGACVGGSTVQCRDEGDCPGVPICSKGECRNDCVADPSSCLADQKCGPDGACYGTSASHDPTAASGGAGGGTGGSGQAGRGGSGGSGSGAAGSENGGASGAAESAGEGGNPAGGQGGASEPAPECTDEGSVRCVDHATTGREVCTGGRWQLMDTCPDGQLCDTTSDPPGRCAPVPDECRGRSPGEAFCAGSVRSVCGPDLVSVVQTPCDSQQLCTLGNGADCAACLPNEHRCVDQTLEGCKPDNTGFEKLEECTDAPCNADAGACTSYACLKGQKRCNRDALEKCKDDQSGWELVENCGAGLCDSAALDCDACVHGSKRCTSESEFSTCDTDGQGETPGSCLDPSPVCTGAGLCVECQQSTDCTAMGPCYTPSCNSGSGKCDQVFNGTHSACNGGGLCDAGGNCVECVTSDDCAPEDDCHPGRCVSGSCQWPAAAPATKCAFDGGKYCDASGACVGCTDVSQCGGGDACNPPACDSTSKKCTTTYAGKNAPCGSGNTEFCDGAGSCVACTTATQCGTAPECNDAVCTSSGSCGTTPKMAGVGCSSSRFCDGNGSCVTCYGSGKAQCGTDYVCRSNACVAAIHTAGWDTATGGATSLVSNVLYLKRLPALSHPATLVNFGIVVPSSGATAKLALYADDPDNGVPTGPSLAESGNIPFPSGGGIKEQAASPSAALASGKAYWIAVMLNATASIDASSGTVTGTQISGTSVSFTNGFPTLPVSGASAGSYSTQIAVYLRIEDTQ